MLNFEYHAPTEFVFGKDAELKAGEMLKKHGASKVLIHISNGQSVIKMGLLKRVEETLTSHNISYIILAGAQPNPIDTKVYEGVAICKKEGVDFILAVGGGSVIDSAKAIAHGACYDGDFWDFWEGKIPTACLKVGVVLTIPAAGSEASNSAVITKTTGGVNLKRGLGSEFNYPAFALINPEIHYTLPAYQTACGIVDMMAHVLERYFTPTKNVEMTDRLCEAILLTIIEMGPIAIKNPTDYNARANLSWAGTIAHNNSCGVGRVGDWASHVMEHELSALYDVAHGAGLAVMFPAWMKYVYETDIDRFVQFATRVWNIADNGDKKEIALKGIAAFESFLVSIGMPINFQQLGAKKEDISTMVDMLRTNKGESIGGLKKLNMDDAKKIYEIAAM